MPLVMIVYVQVLVSADGEIGNQDTCVCEPWWSFPLEEVLLTGDPLKEGSLSRLVLFGSRARLESLLLRC